jgi:hypothetical protein
VPRGYAKLRGEQQGDLADIMSSDSAVCTGCQKFLTLNQDYFPTYHITF